MTEEQSKELQASLEKISGQLERIVKLLEKPQSAKYG